LILSKEVIAKLQRLESIERRWLLTIIGTIVLGAIILTMVLVHLDIGGVIRSEAVKISSTQFLVFLVLAAIILVANISVFIQYFALEVHVERALSIRKRKRGTSEEKEAAAD